MKLNKPNLISALTRNAFPSLVYLCPRSFEGSLHTEKGIPLPLNEGLLLCEEDGLRFEGLLQLLAPGRPCLESLILLPQRGGL